MEQQIFTVYRGDTLQIDAIYRDTNAVPVNIADGSIQISAYIKGRNGVTYPLPIVLGTATGTYSITWNTEDLPLGRSALFIRYKIGDIQRTMNPVTVDVQDV